MPTPRTTSSPPEGPSAPAPAAAPRPKRRWRTGLVAFVLGVASVFVAQAIVNRSAFPDRIVASLLVRDTQGPADVIVVPAAGVTAACTPNLNSLRRALLAARLYREGRAPRLLFTGGPPRSGPACPVAQVMADVARESGVPASVMTLETASRTTWENAELSHPLLAALGARRILLVTDRLHQVRTAACFRRFGYDIEYASVPVFEGHRDNVEMLQQGLREFVAIAAYEWRGRIADPWSTDQRHGRAVALDLPPRLTRMETLAHPNGPLVLLGASYARHWPVSELAGIPVVNKGIDGQQSFELLARFDADVVAHEPRAVIIWGFINDLHRSPRDRVEEAAARARSSLADMVTRARQHGIEPILTTEVTIRRAQGLTSALMSFAGRLLGRRSYQDGINEHVLATNAWIREYAVREKVLLLDVHLALSDARGRRPAEFAAADGTHISPAGYAALTAQVEPRLAAEFRQP